MVIPNCTTTWDFAFWNWQIRSLGQNNNTLNNLVTLSDDKKYIILNTPLSLDLQASLNRISVYDKSFLDLANSKAYQNKMIWLIHQINFRTLENKQHHSYLLVNKRHYEMLGVSPNIMKLMLRALMVMEVIKQTAKASEKNKSCARYATIKPFNQPNCKKHFFNFVEGKCEKFILKWVANDHKVVENHLCKYLKTKPAKPVSSTEEVAALKKRIAFLENAFSNLKIPIPTEANGAADIVNELIHTEVSTETQPPAATQITPPALNEVDCITVTDDATGIITTLTNTDAFREYQASVENNQSESFFKRLATLYEQHKYIKVQITDINNNKCLNFKVEIETAKSYVLTFLNAA